jgi:uncharacterized membrane protein YdcZ (DUF606 family)
MKMESVAAVLLIPMLCMSFSFFLGFSFFLFLCWECFSCNYELNDNVWYWCAYNLERIFVFFLILMFDESFYYICRSENKILYLIDIC